MRIATLLSIVVFGWPLGACSPVGPNSGTVGGACRDDLDCARGSVCKRGGDYPEGMCVVRCRDFRDCPNAADCIDEDGGVCLPWCEFDEDCRPGYECDSKSLEGERGSSRVCWGG